jgi:RNA 3'-terminal phosphate cyclase (ATP)
VTFGGGTDVDFSPSSFFVQEALRPLLARMGVEFGYEVQQYGFEPSGGGRILMTTKPAAALQPIELLEKGSVVEIVGNILVGTGAANSRGAKYNVSAAHA